MAPSCREAADAPRRLLLLAVVLASHAETSEALCSTLKAGATGKMLPKGWRQGLERLHSSLGCSEEAEVAAAPTRPIIVDEGYFKGLEHPVSMFQASLSKQEGEKWGFGVSAMSDYLEIDDVGKAGAVPRWNADNPKKVIKKQDRIVRVNMLEGNATMMQDELRKAANVSLRLIRVNTEDRKVFEQKKKLKEVKKISREPGPPGLGVGIPEPSGSKVVTLHANNIDRFLKNSPYVLLMIYANWCGHCQQLAPKFTAAADLVEKAGLSVPVHFAKFDDGQEANRVYRAGAEDKFNFTSYPRFYWVENGKHVPFGGADDSETIEAHVIAKVKGLDPEEAIKKALLKTRPMLYKTDTDPETVLDLELETFDDIVLKEYEGNNRVWIIEFYSDQCPFCKSLKPEIIKASETLKKEVANVRIAGVNSRVFSDLPPRFGVTSYPWIISVYAGKKVEDMAGLGGAESVIRWAKEMHKKAWKKTPKWSTEPIVAAPPKDDDTGSKEQGVPVGNETVGSWREVLGRRTWFFLHTLAAKYPEEPSKADAAAVRHIVAGLGQHYPCPICRKHLQGKLVDPALGDVPTDSRTKLATWFCNLHNMVNKDLGKPIHSCNAFELDLKYLKSCGECSVKKSVDEEPETAAVSWDFFKYLEGGSKKKHSEL